MPIALWSMLAFLPCAHAQDAMQRYSAGDYPGAARWGAAELAQLPAGAKQDELRLAVANSMAWTGQYDGALEHYRALFGTAYDSQARVGTANVLRWRGQAHRAERFYLEALARDPANADARQGVELAGRELRPAVTARLGRTADNQGASLDELDLTHRRWSADRSLRWEAGVQAGRHETPIGDWTPRGIHASAWLPARTLAPKVEASIYDNAAVGARLFPAIQVEPVRDALRLRLARVDWGRLAFSGAATRDGLTAAALGALAELPTAAGGIRGRFDAYDISDDNRLLDAEAQLTPAWQPMPWQLKWSTGLYGRRAQREDPRYWSPNPAYGIVFLGLQRGWYRDRFDVTASLRRGFAFTQTARNSWSAGLNGRYWLMRDLALGLEAWAVKAPRPATYSMHHVAAFVQRLW